MFRPRCQILWGLLVLLGSPMAWSEWAGTRGLVSIKSDAFISSDYDATSMRQYNYIAVGLRTSAVGHDPWSNEPDFGVQASIEGQFAQSQPVLSYLNVRELYHQEPLVSIGRKLEGWSDLDEMWHLGLYQPQFRWNPLVPESQGLTGVFIRLRGDSGKVPWGVLFFSSPLYLPDQGAGFTVKNRKFETVNPWFSPPPQQARFETTGALDPINYDVQKRDPSQVVFNPSYAAQAFLGDREKGLFFQSAFAYKPSNQLALGFDGNLNANNTVQVSVNPNINYHSLLSADLQYSSSIWQTGLSAIRETAQPPEFETQWTYPVFGQSDLWSPFFAFKLGNIDVRVMRLVLQASSVKAQGPKATEMNNLFLGRFPFGSADALEASTRLQWSRQEGVELKVRYIQGVGEDFSLLTGEARYQVDSRWSVNGRLLLVQSASLVKNVYTDYENNDSGQVGVLYAF